MVDVGRITELWREAADVLERAEREQALEVVQTVAAIAQLRKERDELKAECGRLREQLDATREALQPDVTRTVEEMQPAAFRCYLRVARVLSASDPHDPEDPANSLDTLMAILHSALVDQVCARAALGVVGEPENP